VYLPLSAHEGKRERDVSSSQASRFPPAPHRRGPFKRSNAARSNRGSTPSFFASVALEKIGRAADVVTLVVSYPQ
jgi:hypothetical protein